MLSFENVARLFCCGAGVRDLTFRVEPGGIVALIGLNGAGKTTLAQLALGILRPRNGTVLALGHALDRVPTERWAQVGAPEPSDRVPPLRG